MDSPRSAREVARDLGTSAPRVIRAVVRLRLDVARTSGGRLRLLPRHVRRLEQELGVTPSISGLSRVDVSVLGALASSPFGLPSKRAVAAGGSFANCSRSGCRAADREGLGRARVAIGGDGRRSVGRADPRRRDCPAVAGHRAPSQSAYLHRVEVEQPAAAGSGEVGPPVLEHGPCAARRCRARRLYRPPPAHDRGSRGARVGRGESLASGLEAREPSPRHRSRSASARVQSRRGQPVSLPDRVAGPSRPTPPRRGRRSRPCCRRRSISEEGRRWRFTSRTRPREPATAEPIIRALGYFDDVDEDPGLPLAKADIAAYWKRRQPEIIRNVARFRDGR
jgi:hypothetical protein